MTFPPNYLVNFLPVRQNAKFHLGRKSCQTRILDPENETSSLFVCLFVRPADQLVSMTLVLSHNLRHCQTHLVNQTGHQDSIGQDKGPTKEEPQMLAIRIAKSLIDGLYQPTCILTISVRLRICMSTQFSGK